MPTSRYKLITGTKMWSTWSLRPWLLMRHFGIAFDEIPVPLRSLQTALAIKEYSPSGKVPALANGGLTVWDSLAIIEYLADLHPELPVWPKTAEARAVARCVSAEMHSGFMPLRQNCPMDFTARGLEPADRMAIVPDVTRIVSIWKDCRARFGAGGPFLFGGFSAADAMYAPVASRFTTYGLDLADYDDDGTAAAYTAHIMALPEMVAWGVAATAEAALAT